MAKENICCGCRSNRASNLISSIFLAVLLGILNLPCGLTHIASVLETDGVPGMPAKLLPRGPTVAPVPSPDTLDQLEISGTDDTNTGFFNPAEAIKNLLSLSSATHHGLHGFKRVSQFHGNSNFGLGTGPYYRTPPQNGWDYEEGMDQDDENGKPTFVPYIGARALTNIPQFFEHLKENIEALKHGPSQEVDNALNEDDESENDNDLEGSLLKKDMQKPAARRLKTEFLVDEDMGRTQSRDAWSPKKNWKPRAAGVIHYYASRPNFLETQQNILRRANNYNPAWLYTNLGLGKRRR